MSNFFFTKFLEELEAKDLHEVSKEHGLVVEAVISPKRDKSGTEYGFVRFRKVNNERILATKLDNIFIKGRKLFANIPKFNRNKQGYHGGGDDKELPLRKTKTNPISKLLRQQHFRQGGRSFANVVKGKEGSGRWWC